MAVRVDTQDNIDFGILVGANISVTHVRFRRASDNGQPVVVQLGAAVPVATNQGMRIPSGSFDLVYKSGPLTNAHMLAVIESYWGTSGSRTEMDIDLMTNSTTVVGDAGYSQQQYDNWAVSTENDD